MKVYNSVIFTSFYFIFDRSSERASSLKTPRPLSKQKPDAESSCPGKSPSLLTCHVSLGRSQTIDSLIGLTNKDSIHVDSKGLINIVKRKHSLSSSLDSARRQRQFNVASLMPEVTLSIGDFVFTSRENSQDYWPSVIRKIRNNIEQKVETYCCDVLVPEMLEEGTPVQTDFLEACMLVRYDRLMREDRVRVWSNSKKRYCGAVVVGMCTKEKMSPGGRYLVDKDVLIDVKLEASGVIRRR